MLMCPLGREQPHALQLIKVALQQGIDIRLVAQDLHLGFLTPQLVSEGAIGQMGGGQDKVSDDPVCSRQQMEFEPLDCLLLGRILAVGSPAIPAMLSSRVVKATDRQWQTLQETERPLVGRQQGEQEAEELAANGVGGVAQGTAATVVA